MCNLGLSHVFGFVYWGIKNQKLYIFIYIYIRMIQWRNQIRLSLTLLIPWVLIHLIDISSFLASLGLDLPMFSSNGGFKINLFSFSSVLFAVLSWKTIASGCPFSASGYRFNKIRMPCSVSGCFCFSRVRSCSFLARFQV